VVFTKFLRFWLYKNGAFCTDAVLFSGFKKARDFFKETADLNKPKNI